MPTENAKSHDREAVMAGSLGSLNLALRVSVLEREAAALKKELAALKMQTTMVMHQPMFATAVGFLLPTGTLSAANPFPRQ